MRCKNTPVVQTLTFGLILVCGSLWAAEQEFTYVDLVKRLTDLEQLATLPAPGDQCAQWSSYDRASRYDAATGKYIGWDANGDGDGIIRKEGDKLVLAEMDGPGCIWRIWSAAPKEGHVRIYLDGASEPAVDLPFVGYFDHKNEPFTGRRSCTPSPTAGTTTRRSLTRSRARSSPTRAGAIITISPTEPSPRARRCRPSSASLAAAEPGRAGRGQRDPEPLRLRPPSEGAGRGS